MVFTYICGNLQWSATGSSRTDAAVVGYSSAGTQYLNHRLSGYRSIEDSLSCAVRLGKRRKRQSGGDNTVMINVQNVVNKCLSMLDLDTRRYGDSLIQSRSDLEPCPCQASQAMLDTARFRQQTDDTSCFVSMKPVTVITVDPLGTSENTIYQQCCYMELG